MSAAPADPLSSPDGGQSSHLAVRLQPGARRAGPLGLWNGRLKLGVREPPLEGRANQAAIELLARLFELRASGVSLVQGASSRQKTFRLELDLPRARERLQRLIE